MIKSKSELALHLLTMELRNARSRQKLRVAQQRIMSKKIDNDLFWFDTSLKDMRKYVRLLQKDEEMELRIKKQSKKINRDVGTNMKQTGTHGKTS